MRALSLSLSLSVAPKTSRVRARASALPFVVREFPSSSRSPLSAGPLGCRSALVIEISKEFNCIERIPVGANSFAHWCAREEREDRQLAIDRSSDW